MRSVLCRQLACCAALVASALCTRPAPGAQSRFTRTIQAASPSVVKIASSTRSLLGGRSRRTTNSGVIVTADGYIVTCSSTLGTSKTPEVTLQDGSTVTARIVKRNSTVDLALLKIDRTRLKAIPLNAGDLPRVGQWVVTIGNPFALARTKTDALSASVGVVSAVKRVRGARFRYTGPVIITDIIINPGASGGAMIDLEGRLIGVCGPLLLSSRSNTQLSFAIPVSAVRELLDDACGVTPSAAAPGDPDRGYLGAYILDDPEGKQGAYIQKVVPGSPADAAGLREGDLVTAINHTKTPNGRRLIQALDALKSGDSARLVVRRNKVQTTLTAKLGRVSRPVLK